VLHQDLFGLTNLGNCCRVESRDYS